MILTFWFDTKTTGLDPIKHGIVQLACLIERDRKLIGKKLFYMNPHNKEMTEEALSVHGISREEIETFPLSHKVKKDIEKLLSKFVNKYAKKDENGMKDKFFIGAYNANFDVDMLKQLWVDCGDDYFFSYFHGGAYIDPLGLVAILQTQGLLPMTADRKLETIAELVGVELNNAHDALADIIATQKIYIKLLSILSGQKEFTKKESIGIINNKVKKMLEGK